MFSIQRLFEQKTLVIRDFVPATSPSPGTLRPASSDAGAWRNATRPSGTPRMAKFDRPTEPAGQTQKLKHTPLTSEQPSLVTKDFDDSIRTTTSTAFRLLEQSQTSFREADKEWSKISMPLTSDQKKKAELKKTFVEWRDSQSPSKTIKQDGVAAYQALAGNRSPSLLETHLPAYSPLRAKLHPPNGAFRDPRTGFCCTLEKGADNQFFLCIPGTGRGSAWSAQLKLNKDQFLGTGSGLPPAYPQALSLFEELKAVITAPPINGSLSIAGHSLGGGIASYLGCKHPDATTTCFNAAAVGASVQNELNAVLKGSQPANVTHIQVAGDPVSSPGAQKKLRQVAAFLTGGRTDRIALPVHYGVRYRAPAASLRPANQNPLARHRMVGIADLYAQPVPLKPGAPAPATGQLA